MNKDFLKKINEIKQANDKIFNSISTQTETKNNNIRIKKIIRMNGYYFLASSM